MYALAEAGDILLDVLAVGHRAKLPPSGTRRQRQWAADALRDKIRRLVTPISPETSRSSQRRKCHE
jgi:hypothetical protein